MDLVTIATNVFETYRLFQEGHPVIGSMLTAEFVFPVADIASQAITDRKINLRKVAYTAALAPVYGLSSYVLMKSGDFIGDYIVDNPLAKAALGPNLWGNMFNTFFFVNNTIGEKNNYSLATLVGHYKNLIFGGHSFKEHYLKNIPLKEYLFATAATLTLWNVFQYWNYSSVPKELQTSAALGASLVWMVIFSLLSLQGGRRISY